MKTLDGQCIRLDINVATIPFSKCIGVNLSAIGDADLFDIKVQLAAGPRRVGLGGGIDDRPPIPAGRVHEQIVSADVNGPGRAGAEAVRYEVSAVCDLKGLSVD